MISPEPVPEIVSTGTCIPGGRKAGRISTSVWRLASILPSLLLPTGPLDGDRLAARCCAWYWNCSWCCAWEGIGVRWGDKKPAGWARGGSRLSAELKRARAWDVGTVGSKYCTPPGRDKGEMTEEAWLPTRPASDISRLLSMAPGGREESKGSLVMT